MIRECMMIGMILNALNGVILGVEPEYCASYTRALAAGKPVAVTVMPTLGMCSHTRAHTNAHINTHTRTHARTHKYIHAHTRTYTYKRTHTYTHTRSHTHTHTHTHTQTLSLSPTFSLSLSLSLSSLFSLSYTHTHAYARVLNTRKNIPFTHVNTRAYTYVHHTYVSHVPHEGVPNHVTHEQFYATDWRWC